MIDISMKMKTNCTMHYSSLTGLYSQSFVNGEEGPKCNKKKMYAGKVSYIVLDSLVGCCEVQSACQTYAVETSA